MKTMRVWVCFEETEPPKILAVGNHKALREVAQYSYSEVVLTSMVNFLKQRKLLMAGVI